MAAPTSAIGMREPVTVEPVPRLSPAATGKPGASAHLGCPEPACARHHGSRGVDIQACLNLVQHLARAMVDVLGAGGINLLNARVCRSKKVDLP